MRREAGNVDAAPSKRLYLSIIADYDLNKAICELVDNVIDIWSLGNAQERLRVGVELDMDQQVIRFEDNAGGVKEEDLHLIVGPGQTNVDPSRAVIGIFGVGSKRAVVALAQETKITSRAGGSPHSFRLEVDDAWLASEDWELPYYEVDNIAEGTTIIELQRLRSSITRAAIERLTDHLGATYDSFLSRGQFELKVNGNVVPPLSFEEWAFPPEFEPRDFQGTLNTGEGDTVKVRGIAGLTLESHPTGEYGLYLYCNDRLVVQGLHDATVGFVTGEVGQPHPDISLARLVVYLDGPARAMPWNSSKSGVNPSHKVFVALREWMVSVLKEWASLSRRWSGEWESKVFSHTSGSTVEVEITEFPLVRRTYLPPQPISRPRYPDRVRMANEQIANDKPWTRGLYESISAVELIYHQPLTQKNRICLIVLDSTLEIAFKEFLVHDSGEHYSNTRISEIFDKRHLVNREVKRHVTFTPTIWGKIDHYYDVRCDLIHKRATENIPDADIRNYRGVVEEVLTKLFGLKFPA